MSTDNRCDKTKISYKFIADCIITGSHWHRGEMYNVIQQNSIWSSNNSQMQAHKTLMNYAICKVL